MYIDNSVCNVDLFWKIHVLHTILPCPGVDPPSILWKFPIWATIHPYTYTLWPNLSLMHVHAIIVYTYMHTSNLVEISQTLKCLTSCFSHTFFNQLTEYTSGASKYCFVVLIISCLHIHMPCTYIPKLV